MHNIETIRYMGIKNKLLDYIIPEIERITPAGGTICDIMCGSNTVAYALKEKFALITNDVQEYSYVISKAIIVNQSQNISKSLAKQDLEMFYFKNLEEKKTKKTIVFSRWRTKM